MGPMTPLLLATLSGENISNFSQRTGINTVSGMLEALLSGKWIPHVLGNFMSRWGINTQAPTMDFNAGARPHQFPEARFTEVKHV